MSFLDNLENSLKSLENSEEGRANRESEHRQRERERLAQGNKAQLRQSPKQYMKNVDDNFNQIETLYGIGYRYKEH